MEENSTMQDTPRSELLAHWCPSDWPLTPGGLIVPAVDITDKKDSFFRGNIFSVWQGVRRVYAGHLRVAPKMRGLGIGRELVCGLGALAYKYDFSNLSAGLASQYSLDIFVSIFGMDNITLFGLDSGGRDIAEMLRGKPLEYLRIGYNEARAELVALEREEKDLEDRRLGFYAAIKFDGIDMGNWSLPKEHHQDGLRLEDILQ